MNENKIIFCHYGNSEYLQYTLKQAKLSNPEAEIILLGDYSNKSLAVNNHITHINYHVYENNEEVRTFDSVYTHIAGKKHGKEYWTKFVFKRWFYVNEFIKENNIDNFWHFDSDNMILSNLKDQEYKFKDYDCTEQCNGSCMNGYISSPKVVEDYINKIIKLFSDKDFLESIKEVLVLHPEFAFTEMKAYEEYKKESEIKSIRLNSIINNESFDDCICQNHGYDTYEKDLMGRKIKKIYIDYSGSYFCYNINLKKYIKINSLNLSWVPDSLFKRIYNINNDINKLNDYILIKKDGFILLDIYKGNNLINYKFMIKKYIKGLISYVK